MKTRIYKYISSIMISSIIISGLVYAAGSVSVFTDVVNDGYNITSAWYTNTNGALSKIFNNDGSFKSGVIPSSTISETNGKWCKSNGASIVCDQDAPVGGIPLFGGNHSTADCTGIGGEIITDNISDPASTTVSGFTPRGSNFCKIGKSKGTGCDNILKLTPYNTTLTLPTNSYQLDCLGYRIQCPKGWSLYNYMTGTTVTWNGATNTSFTYYPAFESIGSPISPDATVATDVSCTIKNDCTSMGHSITASYGTGNINPITCINGVGSEACDAGSVSYRALSETCGYQVKTPATYDANYNVTSWKCGDGTKSSPVVAVGCY
ncbi:MAG: hypothetical protein PHS92_02770 [Candidatus Gracilibacteria bacterium]|nr:hypothetical protein [Candidatus Gracilibacteria bacterium]